MIDPTIGCWPVQRFVESMEPCSMAFMVRFGASGSASAEMSAVIEEALRPVLLEPACIDVFALDPHTLATIITPSTGQPFDPLFIHSLLNMLRRVLPERRADGAETCDGPVIVPLSYVSSVSLLQQNITDLNDLLETLVNNRLRVQFQPIIELAAARPHGYEALIRGPKDAVLKRPGALFKTADKARLVSWLDVACQQRCFEEAARNGVRERLFVNMDAEGLAYLHLADRSLADGAEEVGISPRNIVLEITERQAVEDFPRLLQYIQWLRAQGFMLAIDDAGNGYSSLEAIAEIRPDYIKVERSLVRSLRNSGMRRALLSALAKLADQVGTSIVAEGIETRDELAAVIDAGVAFGQGYLLGRPNDVFKGLRRAMQDLLEQRYEHRRKRMGGRSYPVSEIAREGATVPRDATLADVTRKLDKDPDLGSVVLTDEGHVVGIITRDRLRAEAPLDGADRPALPLMDPLPITVEAAAPVEEVANQVTYLPESRFGVDLVVVRAGQYQGILPVRALMEAVATLKVNQARHSDPLTGLPGPAVSEQEATRCLRQGQPTAIMHAEVENFREFNETYGLVRGDEVITEVAGVLDRAMMRLQVEGGFLGHLGGDDFLVLLPPDLAHTFGLLALGEFKALGPRLQPHEPGASQSLDEKDARRPLVGPLMLRISGVQASNGQSRRYRDLRDRIGAARRTPRPDGRIVLLPERDRPLAA